MQARRLVEVAHGRLGGQGEGLWRQNLPIPNLIVADVAAEVADGCVVRRDRLDLQRGNQEEMVLRALRLLNVMSGLPRLLVKDVLDPLGLGDVDVALAGHIDDLTTNIAALAELQFWRPQSGIDVEVDEAPVFEHAVEANDAANVPRQLLPALRRRQVRVLIFSVELDDKIAVIDVRLWILVRKLIAEELWQRPHFKLMDGRKVEPLSRAWQQDGLLRILALVQMLDLALSLVDDFGQIHLILDLVGRCIHGEAFLFGALRDDIFVLDIDFNVLGRAYDHLVLAWRCTVLYARLSHGLLLFLSLVPLRWIL